MPTAAEWQRAANNQRIRADELERREEDLLHALNLLVNDAVQWFAEYPDIEGYRHQFGLGVAINAEVPETLFARLEAGGQKENRGIVFWKTKFSPTHKYISAYSIFEFKQLPDSLRRNEKATSKDLHSDIVSRVVERVDEVYQEYVAQRKKQRGQE